MTDGCSDATDHIRDAFETNIKRLIACLQNLDRADIVGNQVADLIHNEIPSQALSVYLGFPAWLAERYNHPGDVSPLTQTAIYMFGLQYARCIPLVHIFQKSHPLIKGKLVILTDDNWQVGDKGSLKRNVFYQDLPAHQYFLDGDQDIIVGLAKKRYRNQFIAGRPFMAVASWHLYKKCWRLNEAVQPQ